MRQERPVADAVGLEGYGLRSVERVEIPIPPNEKNARYLRTKGSERKLEPINDESPFSIFSASSFDVILSGR
jgi:hypothetical protein